MKEIIKLSLQKELKREMEEIKEEIKEEIERHPELAQMKVSEEMDAKFFERARALEAELKSKRLIEEMPEVEPEVEPLSEKTSEVERSDEEVAGVKRPCGEASETERLDGEVSEAGRTGEETAEAKVAVSVPSIFEIAFSFITVRTASERSRWWCIVGNRRKRRCLWRWWPSSCW